MHIAGLQVEIGDRLWLMIQMDGIAVLCTSSCPEERLFPLSAECISARIQQNLYFLWKIYAKNLYFQCQLSKYTITTFSITTIHSLSSCHVPHSACSMTRGPWRRPCLSWWPPWAPSWQCGGGAWSTHDAGGGAPPSHHVQRTDRRNVRHRMEEGAAPQEASREGPQEDPHCKQRNPIPSCCWHQSPRAISPQRTIRLAQEFCCQLLIPHCRSHLQMSSKGR